MSAKLPVIWVIWVHLGPFGSFGSFKSGKSTLDPNSHALDQVPNTLEMRSLSPHWTLHTPVTIIFSTHITVCRGYHYLKTPHTSSLKKHEGRFIGIAGIMIQKHWELDITFIHCTPGKQATNLPKIEMLIFGNNRYLLKLPIKLSSPA